MLTGIVGYVGRSVEQAVYAMPRITLDYREPATLRVLLYHIPHLAVLLSGTD